MTSLQRYIAEEIATDHVDGLLTRREALRRLALLRVGTAAAAALIAARSRKQRPAGPDAPAEHTRHLIGPGATARDGRRPTHTADHLAGAAGPAASRVGPSG